MAPKPPIEPSSTVISTSWFARQLADQVHVQRLGEARIGDGGRQAEAGELVGRRQAFRQPRAERQQRDRRALAHDAALADLKRRAALGQLDADALAARIAEGDGPSSIAAAVATMCIELRLVGRRHHHEAGQAARIGDVEGAGMGRAVGADQPGAVDGEAHRQLLDGDVVHDLVVGALQEGRIDGGERLQAFGGQAGGEGHRMLLGDADIEAALRERLRRTGRARCRTAWPR